MKKPLTAPRLRENIYRILDEVLETGIPVQIEHRGKILKIVAGELRDKLDNIQLRPDFLRCDPEDLAHLDWSGEWQP